MQNESATLGLAGNDGPIRDTGKVFIIALRCGRLANRLVLFANFIAFAAERGHRVTNVTFHSYAHLFETTRRDIYCQYPIPLQSSWLDACPTVAAAIRKTRIFYHAVRAVSRLNQHLPLFGNRVVTLRELPAQEVTLLDDPRVQAQIREARIVFAYDWRFRAPAFIAFHAEKIRAYFQPIAAVERASRQALDRLRQDSDVVVGVHVRHGDYRTWKGGRSFFPVSQYAAWMLKLAAQFPGQQVSFFVCSDEPRNANEFPGLRVGLGTGSAVGDLWALAKCDYIFGPVSTFSQWASFYGNKPLFHLADRNTELQLARFRVSLLEEIP